MGDSSGIEWCDATWNPVTGCSHVSDGCRFCYAETLTRKFAGQWDAPDLPWTAGYAAANVILHPDRLDMPMRWRKPRTIFVNSMSDLFHELVPVEFIARVFAVMGTVERHTFQVLTKRPERMAEVLTSAEFRALLDDGRGAFPYPNVWLGTSIESARHVDRADWLRETPAAHRFISAEPLLGPLVRFLGWRSPRDRAHGVTPELLQPAGLEGPGLDLRGIDWLIAGGESGGHFRERPDRFLVNAATRGRPKAQALEWVRDLRDACEREGAAFMLKQWGGLRPKSSGRELDGVEHTWTPPRAGTVPL